MPFTEALKAKVRRRAHLACCLCKSMGVEIHHIIPQEENGPDTEDNAAPLCPSCHELYGANPQKRKFIREARDLWYDICERRYASDPNLLADIERALKNIEAHVQTSNYPLLPFALFYTLRHTTSEDAIESVFKETEGYKSLKSDVLQLVGTARLGGSGLYNYIELSPKHSHSKLSDEALGELIDRYSGWGDGVIKSPVSTTIEFFFPATNSEPDKPSLALKKAFGDGKPREVKSLELFDDLIFQDVFATGWEVTTPSKRAWNVNDLQGARVRLQWEMLSFDNINFQRPPVFHNLHMYFGRTCPHILFFSAEQLAQPIITEELSLKIRFDFSAVGMEVRPLRMTYEFRIDDELFFNQIKQVV